MEEQFTLSKNMKENLLSGAKWLKFFAVLMTISLALIACLAVCFIVFTSILTPELGSIGGISLGLLYFIIIALYIYPLIKTYNLVSHIRQGVNDYSQEGLEMATDDFASALRYVGIITIICLVLYAIGIISLIVSGLAVGNL